MPPKRTTNDTHVSSTKVKINDKYTQETLLYLLCHIQRLEDRLGFKEMTPDELAHYRDYVTRHRAGGFFSSLWDGIKSVGKKVIEIAKPVVRAGLPIATTALATKMGPFGVIAAPVMNEIGSHALDQVGLGGVYDEDEDEGGGVRLGGAYKIGRGRRGGKTIHMDPHFLGTTESSKPPKTRVLRTQKRLTMDDLV